MLRREPLRRRRHVAPRAGRAGDALPPARQNGPQAIAGVLQHQDHQHAEEDQFEVGVGIDQLGQDVLQLVLDSQDDRRAQQRPPDMAGAADHGHEEVFDAVVQAERTGADRALHMGIQPARQAGQQRRPHEDDDFVDAGIDPHRLGHAGAALQGADGAARTRIEQVARRPQRQQHEHPDQVVNMASAGQRPAEQADGLDAGDAVMLAEPVQVAEQVIQREPPGDGAQRQIMPRQPQRDQPQQERHHGRHQQAHRQRQPRRDVVLRGEQCRGVGAQAHEGRLAERGQAAHAGQQHQPQRHHGGQADVVELRDPEFGRGRQQRQAGQHDDECDKQEAVHGAYSSSST
ncbi:hypothetical protein L559_2967 [Bordetella pertussis STO1-CHOC-0017]|nr:hypothetical protein L559_2967 [Bordetella pertussis STO1-CHOC-0017]